MKYVLYIDYLCEYGSYEYMMIDAKTIIEAITECNRILEKLSGKVYLARIMRKTGKAVKCDSFKFNDYKAVYCKRSGNWYENSPKNGEREHYVRYFYDDLNLGFNSYFETL